MIGIMASLVTTKRMKAVRTKNTHPEVVVRKILHSIGLRFRLNRKDLPGSPDVVLPKHETIIFIHGCYWHRHPGCRYATTPKTNQAFWLPKFQRNVERDARKEDALRALGWRVLIVWECETRDKATLEARLRKEFELPPAPPTPEDGD